VQVLLLACLHWFDHFKKVTLEVRLGAGLHRTLPQTGRFSTPGHKTADSSLQQTQAVKHFHRNLLPSAICRLCHGGNRAKTTNLWQGAV